MSKLKVSGNASGTGVITLEAPNTNTDRAITLPDSAGELINIAPSTSGNVLTSDGTDWTSAAAAGGGKVLQVVSTTKTDYFVSSSSSFVDITGLAATITPASTSSKILVFVNFNASGDSNSNTGWSAFDFRVSRNQPSSDTDLVVGDALGSRNRSSIFYTSSLYGTDQLNYRNFTYLDSPNTTSATTYKLRGKRTSPSGQWFMGATQNSSSSYSGTAPMNITLMEIGA